MLKYEPNTVYGIKLRAKASPGASLTADVYNYTTNLQLGSVSINGTGWNLYTFNVSTPVGENHDVRIRIYGANGSDSGFVDEVRMLPQNYNSSIPNGSFETADLFDATLPRFWTRGASTTAANAETDVSQYATGLRSLKLLTSDMGGKQELYYEWKGYRPNGNYELTVTAKTNGSAAGGNIKIFDATTGSTLIQTAITSTAWENAAITFTAPHDHDHVLKVMIEHDNPSVAGGILWVDDLAIKLQ